MATTAASTGPAGRLLALLALLQGRRDWPGPELAGRLGVSVRTVRRDVERLRELGYPIASETGPAGRYTLRAGAAMPPLLLDDEEAIAIAVGLRTAAGAAVGGIEETALRALVKLEQVLPAHLRRRVQALAAATTTGPDDGRAVDAQALATLAAATRDRESVRFAYTRRDGTSTRRHVEPHALVTLDRRWYCVAFDPSRTAWRSFRVDRMERVGAAGTRFTPRVLPGGDPAAFVARGQRQILHEHETEVVYEAPLADVAARAGWGFSSLEPLGPHRCRARLGDDDVHRLAVRILFPGAPFSLDGPPALLAHLARLGEQLRGDR
jgi:predicted DNA-binding transcriptional regulator YafY